jgi:hypothetical protein
VVFSVITVKDPYPTANSPITASKRQPTYYWKIILTRYSGGGILNYLCFPGVVFSVITFKDPYPTVTSPNTVSKRQPPYYWKIIPHTLLWGRYSQLSLLPWGGILSYHF